MKKSNPTLETYASKAARPKERVLDILSVYSTQSSKSPLSPQDWELLDGQILDQMLNQDSDYPLLVQISNLGYDAKHDSGFTACRDRDSAKWCQRVIREFRNPRGKAFRACARGEQPENKAPICHLITGQNNNNLH